MQKKKKKNRQRKTKLPRHLMVACICLATLLRENWPFLILNCKKYIKISICVLFVVVVMNLEIRTRINASN